ncbi:uncharacterized protein LOC116263973 isoform X2 [Nymphaea colorata]|uniref:uncharacterized protein LOC116263973 isoform X2 n=1 Tax=Nymphaea colorata TaxID=210225 RepID=UPI00129EDC26|nr:uncharacterized protein LOC116263973 isoform X2 [Nymphaea colorata]
MVFFRSLLPRLQTLRHPPFRASLHYSVFARMKGKVAPFQDKGKKVAASQGNELVVWKGATEHGESSPREQHGSSTQTYLPLGIMLPHTISFQIGNKLKEKRLRLRSTTTTMCMRSW